MDVFCTNQNVFGRLFYTKSDYRQAVVANAMVGGDNASRSDLGAETRNLTYKAKTNSRRETKTGPQEKRQDMIVYPCTLSRT